MFLLGAGAELLAVGAVVVDDDGLVAGEAFFDGAGFLAELAFDDVEAAGVLDAAAEGADHEDAEGDGALREVEPIGADAGDGAVVELVAGLHEFGEGGDEAFDVLSHGVFGPEEEEAVFAEVAEEGAGDGVGDVSADVGGDFFDDAVACGVADGGVEVAEAAEVDEGGLDGRVGGFVPVASEELFDAHVGGDACGEACEGIDFAAWGFGLAGGGGGEESAERDDEGFAGVVVKYEGEAQLVFVADAGELKRGLDGGARVKCGGGDDGVATDLVGAFACGGEAEDFVHRAPADAAATVEDDDPAVGGEGEQA